MNEHVNPVIREALRGHIPFLAPGTPPDEAERVRADIEHQNQRERIRDDAAMRIQIQHNRD